MNTREEIAQALDELRNGTFIKESRGETPDRNPVITRTFRAHHAGSTS